MKMRKLLRGDENEKSFPAEGSLIFHKEDTEKIELVARPGNKAGCFQAGK